MKYLKDSWRRWLAWLLLACVFAVACVALSNWQLARRQEKLVEVTAISRNYAKPTVDIASVVGDRPYAKPMEWTPVALTGHYVSGSMLLVRNRSLNGAPGFEQLFEFAAADGKTYVVDRGWLPTGEARDYPDAVPTPDFEQRLIVARLVNPEPNLNRDAPAGEITSIFLPKIADGRQQVEQSFYLMLAAESPASEANARPLPAPIADEGNHLSYAMQWIVFAVMAFGALGWAIRQEIIFKRMAADPTYRPKQRKRVGDDDKNAEDQALDA